MKEDMIRSISLSWKRSLAWILFKVEGEGHTVLNKDDSFANILSTSLAMFDNLSKKTQQRTRLLQKVMAVLSMKEIKCAESRIKCFLSSKFAFLLGDLSSRLVAD